METTAETVDTAAGPVELATYGSGVPILVLHGSPSGVDGARAMSRFLPEDQFKTICISRPGYLRTPLASTDSSIDCEADILAAVLDTVGCERAGVLAWSGGGYAAYRFAVRHPTRVTAIVAIAAVSFRWIAPKPNLVDKIVFDTAIGGKLISLFSRKVPRHLVHEALESEGSLRGEELNKLTDHVMADEQSVRLILEIAQTMNISGARKAGWQNDVTNAAAVESLELELVQCPVLLVHGEGDTDASVEHSYFAHSNLPNSSLIIMKSGTHLSFYAHPEARDVQGKARKWLLDHPGEYSGDARRRDTSAGVGVMLNAY